MTTYTPPTPLEARKLLARWQLTGATAAALIDAHDSRTVRRWTSGKRPRRIPYTTLYTLVHRASATAITPGGWRRELGL